MSLDYTDRPANGGGGTLHIEMKAEGKYKGQVGDDAWLTTSEQQLIITPPLPGIEGRLDDPNH